MCETVKELDLPRTKGSNKRSSKCHWKGNIVRGWNWERDWPTVSRSLHGSHFVEKLWSLNMFWRLWCWLWTSVDLMDLAIASFNFIFLINAEYWTCTTRMSWDSGNFSFSYQARNKCFWWKVDLGFGVAMWYSYWFRNELENVNLRRHSAGYPWLASLGLELLLVVMIQFGSRAAKYVSLKTRSPLK